MFRNTLFKEGDKSAKTVFSGPGEMEIAGKINELADLAEKYCLVSRSVACPVHYELQVKTIGK